MLGREQIEEFWARCLLRAEAKIPRQSFETWLRPTRLLHLDSEIALIEVPSSFFAEWLEQHYLSLIKSVILEQGALSPQISFSVADTSEERQARPAVSAEVQTAAQEEPHSESTASLFNPRYTFDTFVVGKSNQFAHAASLAVAESPGTTGFNPLLIYAGVGLGKTHILQAIAQYCLSRGKAKKVNYVSSEKFTNDFISSIQNNNTVEFNRVYRSSDVLLVDDVHFFIGKESTQEAFFHTFNTLHQNGKQIVLTSDRPPRELKGLEERLISRFQWGLVTDIQPPDYETRVAILRKKAEIEDIQLPDEVIFFIAKNISSNIRELEGALIRLLAYSSITGDDISLDLTSKVLKDIIKSSSKNINIESIQSEVSNFYNIPIDLIIGKTRRKEVVTARQVAMYLAKILTNSSLKTIGLHFGGRDHSTVIHSYQLVEQRKKTDKQFNHQINNIISKIKGL
ncbi:MAG TPA: chromosomal replication initiator protein DnaA [Firmicutes bacterium]|nr:MAG: chromosomal replication initiator protein DnaA [Candidatus Latescibacterota bacterium]HDN67605.1 chromosomal replication initiator protein DnaA [Bacillota bacterium]